jgi:RNase H-fold protein (predicted Holliday junction resolvase)
MAPTEVTSDKTRNKPVSTEEIKEINDFSCALCDQLKLELQKAKTEIASYEEILKIMRDELPTDTTAVNVASNMETKETDTSHLLTNSPIISSKWIQPSSRNQRKGEVTNGKGTRMDSEQLLKTRNRFLPLIDLSDQLDGLSNYQKDKGNQSLIRTAHKNNTLSKEGFKIPTIVNGKIIESEVRNCKSTHKVEIVGDSYFIGSAVNMNQFLNTTFSVISFIKSGAPISELVSSQRKELKKLKKNDVIVFSGGANDMDNINRTKGSDIVKKITKFIQTYNNTNIVILGIPHRFDLNKDSEINLEIQKINTKLRVVTNSFSHVSMIEMEPKREFFTKHGLHFNKIGKEKLAKSIANLISQTVLSEHYK